MTPNLASWAVRLGIALCLAVFRIAGGAQAAPGPDATTPAVVTAARDALPDDIKHAGVLRLATSLQWPPFDYTNDKGAATGIDIDLITLLSEKLGLKLELTNVKFPSIVPGVTTGRFDVGMDQLARTAEREKVAQFVVYFRSGLGLLVRKGVTDVDVHHLCGRTLALTQGSSQVAVAQRLSDACVKAGNKAIGFLFFPTSADTYLAVSNGRGDGFLTGEAVGVYIADHDDKLHMTREILRGDRHRQGQRPARESAPARIGERDRRRLLREDPQAVRCGGRRADRRGGPQSAGALRYVPVLRS